MLIVYQEVHGARDDRGFDPEARCRALGVHEQTLRSWEHNGIIRMIRLPGSG